MQTTGFYKRHNTVIRVGTLFELEQKLLQLQLHRKQDRVGVEEEAGQRLQPLKVGGLERGLL